MMKRTHIAISVAVTIPFIIHNPIVIVGLLGSVAPDWDYKVGIKHRTITHSFLALVISSAVVSILNEPIVLVWSLNYALHLLADSMTVSGVPLFYPVKKTYGFRLIKTGGAEDYFIQLLAIAFIVFRYI